MCGDMNMTRPYRLGPVLVASSPITIDKGIPVGQDRPSNNYPLSAMEIGDSFFVRTHSVNSVRGSVRFQLKRQGLSYTVTVCKVEGGARVWRIS